MPSGNYSRSRPTSKERPKKTISTYLKPDLRAGGKFTAERGVFIPGMSGSVGDCEDGPPVLIQAGQSRSIEIFFGKFTTFDTFHQALCDNGVSVPDSGRDVCTTKFMADSIKKLVMVGHPMTSFGGLSRFTKLSEAWVTNCQINEGKWSDFDGMKSLHKLYIQRCGLEKLEALHFQNLKILWVAGNRLTSLSFLGNGIPTLTELNAAGNLIICVHEEQLFKCLNLQILNLSGNQLCTVQDIQAVKVLTSLQDLYLADPLYGKCPVTSLCDSRVMLLSILTNLTNLDGKAVSSSELCGIHEYVSIRSLYYYAKSHLVASNQVYRRKVASIAASKNIEGIGQRLTQLLSISAQYKRAVESMDFITVFANAKNLLRDHHVKIEVRINKLKELVTASIKRLATVQQISKWEQEAEKWMAWIEFQSYGNTQCHILQSVHGARVDDSVQLLGCMHQLLSSLACPTLWPQSTLTKIETVIVFKDKGMEAGMEATFESEFAAGQDPEFVAPPPEQTLEAYQIPLLLGPQYPYYGLPTPPTKPVQTYMRADYRAPAPTHNFPDSVPGLPDRMQPLFLFLMCPPSASSNPMIYLHRVMTEKSRHYKDIRVTNCMWTATTQFRTGANNFAVVVVVKVLAECLQAIQIETKKSAQHSWDCTCFCLTKPLSFTPCYILNISFSTEEKHLNWHKGTPNDDDILTPAKTALNNLTGKIHTFKFPPGTKRRPKKSPFLRKVCDGIHADLASVQLCLTKDGSIEPIDPLSTEQIPTQSPFDIQNVAKFLGLDATQFLTTLDLTGNRLGLTVGLEGLTTLKKLNLSHNNLTTLSGLSKFPSLIEFKVGYNYLRFLHSNANLIAWAAPRLMTLEVMPNPFQDIRDYSHIPILMRKILPVLHKVDHWSFPFMNPTPFSKLSPPPVADVGFTHVAMVKSWVGSAHAYNELASRCLTTLDHMPPSPPFPEGFGSNGMDLNLSDNYLNSLAIGPSPFVKNNEWRTSLVKLQLQENLIACLDWAKDTLFPNVQILNLSNNFLTQVEVLPQAFPALRYLHLSANPLAGDLGILAPIRVLTHLCTLDCAGSPLSRHPEYPSYVHRFIPSVQMLDGKHISRLEVSDSVERTGATLNSDWIEDKVGHKDFGTLSQLSFPNSNLHKISLPSHSVSKLMSLDLSDNNLSSFTGLSSLPNLKALSVSHNSISALGSQPCPSCFAHTVESQAANAQKLKRPTSKSGPRPDSFMGLFTAKAFGGDHFHLTPDTSSVRSQNHVKTLSNSKYSPPVSGAQARKTKQVFPKLELLVLAHNGLQALNDLHLHAMPSLHTIVLSCNQLTALTGLSDLPTLKILVLDNNEIKDVPSNSLIGCESLRYLHLQHNRITALPRLPHLTNLASLYLAFNKINLISDLSAIAGSGISELSLIGNPFSTRDDYRLHTTAKLPQLNVLDGEDLASEKSQLNELKSIWFPATVDLIRGYATNDTMVKKNRSTTGSEKDNGEDYGLKVRNLSSRLALVSPRSLQFSTFYSGRRNE